MFLHIIRGWFGGCRAEHNAFLKALLSDDLEGMNVYMNEVSGEMFSSSSPHLVKPSFSITLCMARLSSPDYPLPISTLLPSKAKPYFLIRSGGGERQEIYAGADTGRFF